MITCALTKDQITIVYKKIYKELSTKGQEFNPDSFMKELFNQIAEKSTPETAANFLQVVPSIIASQLITDFKRHSIASIHCRYRNWQRIYQL